MLLDLVNQCLEKREERVKAWFHSANLRCELDRMIMCHNSCLYATPQQVVFSKFQISTKQGELQTSIFRERMLLSEETAIYTKIMELQTKLFPL